MAPGLGDVQLHLVDNVDDAQELMRWLSGVKCLAVDTETEGLNTRRDRVRLVQVGDRHHGWTIPWDRWGGVFEEVLRRFTGEYVLHNMPYDWAMLKNSCGIELPRHRMHDTRVMAHVLHPDRSTALKSLSAHYLDPQAAALQQQLDDVIGNHGGWTWATVPIDYEPYWSYAALDTVLTAQLDELLRPRVLEEAPKAYELECATLWVTLGMSDRGAQIDRAYTQDKYDAFTAYVSQIEQWCIETYGCKPGSKAKVIERLMADGVEFSKKTETGFSLDKEVLGVIDHPLAQAVLSGRQIQKIASTYLKNFLELADNDDLLHPSINPLGFREATNYGVITGRMSMNSPNLQNLSRASADDTSPSNVVRNCIVSRPDHTLLMCDFDQIEARLIAHLTGDPGFIAAFGKGDFFTVITQAMWNDDTILKKDPRRQSTKNAIYARAYGAGAPKFARTAGIPEQAAVAMYDRLDQLYPGWMEFSKQVERTAKERFELEGVPYVRSFMTGRRHVSTESKIYTLVNYLIQGTAAEIFKMKLVQLDQAGLGEFMILPVHDEVILDVPEKQVREVATTVAAIMSDKTLLTVPLNASPSIGKRWGTKEDLVL